MKSKFIYLALLVALAAGHIQAASYYVSTAGSDKNPGTQAAPWATLNKVGVTKFAPGDVIYFRNGDSFCGFLRPSVGGTPTKPIRFDAYGGGAYPVISACKASGYALILSGLSNLTFTHLVFTSGRQSAAYISTTSQAPSISNLTFNLDTFEDSTGAGINFEGADGTTCNNIQILNSIVTGNTGDGILFACPGDTITIQGNTVTYNVTTAAAFGAGIRVVNDGTSDVYRQTNVHVLGNKSYYNGIGSGGNANYTGDGIHMDTLGTGMVVSGNDVENNSSHGIEIEWTGTTGSHLVQGNTAIKNKGRGIILYQRSWGVQIIQNTASQNAGNIFLEGRYGGEDVGMVNNYVSQNWAYDPVGDVSFGAVDGANNDGKNGRGNTYPNNCWGADGPNYFRWGNTYLSTAAALAVASDGEAINTCTAKQLPLPPD